MKLKTRYLAIQKRVRALSGQRIFCVSYQKTGTSSVGKLFKDNGRRMLPPARGRKDDWGIHWLTGDYQRILRSRLFLTHEVFQDDPWWYGDFYRVLFHRFPRSRFILLERDADRWFASMMRHSDGRTLGNTHVHATLYDRLEEFNDTFDATFENAPHNGLALTEQHRAHYTRIYCRRNDAIKRFFDHYAPSRLFRGRLEDPEVWTRMGRSFGLDLPDGYSVHANRTKSKQASD